MFAKVYVFTQFLPLHICWAYMSNIWRMVVETAKKLCFRPWKSRIFKKNLMFDFWLHFCSSQCNESNWAVLSRFFQKVAKVYFFTQFLLLHICWAYMSNIWRIVEMAKTLRFRPWKSWIFKRNFMFDFWLHFCSSQWNAVSYTHLTLPTRFSV